MRAELTRGTDSSFADRQSAFFPQQQQQTQSRISFVQGWKKPRFFPKFLGF